MIIKKILVDPLSRVYTYGIKGGLINRVHESIRCAAAIHCLRNNSVSKRVDKHASSMRVEHEMREAELDETVFRILREGKVLLNPQMP